MDKKCTSCSWILVARKVVGSDSSLIYHCKYCPSGRVIKEKINKNCYHRGKDLKVVDFSL